MKIYSIAIICLTLGLFYSLAVHQQKNWTSKELKSFVSEIYMDNFEHESDIAPYLMMEDDFSMQVTGKEHRYLNTGISYMEQPTMIEENQCIAENGLDPKPNISGS